MARKPWGKGTLVPALACGAVGAGTGWVIQNNRPGCTALNVEGEPPVVVCDDKEQWKGALIGGAVGLVLCGLVGHMVFDPEAPTPTPTPTLPPPTPTPRPVKKKIILRGVEFDYDKSDIRPDARPVLEEAVAILRENPDVKVVIEGHTDSIASEAYNQKLSERRARAVYRYLVAAGIDPARLSVVGYGESRPIASNDTPEGRARNRRVELRILGP